MFDNNFSNILKFVRRRLESTFERSSVEGLLHHGYFFHHDYLRTTRHDHAEAKVFTYRPTL